MSKKIGFRMRQMLKPDAVPTIFHRPSDPPAQKRVSTAYKKRERTRVSLVITGVIHSIMQNIIIMYNVCRFYHHYQLMKLLALVTVPVIHMRF